MNLFIGIGGTGQHVALAMTRLIRLGALPETKAYIIDGENISQLAQKVMSFASVETLPHPLKGSEQIHPPSKDIGKKGTFRELFMPAAPAPGEKELFETFFSDEDSELELSKGMYGRPSIGATVVAKSIDDALIPLLKEVDLIGPEEYIYIAGSFIGGTGAGITHELISELHNKREDIKIFGTFFLPWFKLPSEAKISDSWLDNNMRHGLSYFHQKTINFMKSAILIGSPDQAENDHAIGKHLVEQNIDEIEHLFSLLAAYGLVYLKEKTISAGDKGQAWYFSHNIEDPGWIYGLDWEKPPKHDSKASIIDYYNHGVFLAEMYRWLTKDMEEEIKNAFGWFGQKTAISVGLYNTIKKHADKKQNRNIDVLLQDNWKARLSQLENSYKWLERICDFQNAAFNISDKKSTFVKELLEEKSESKLHIDVLNMTLGKGINPTDKTRTDTNELADVIELQLSEYFWDKNRK